MYVHKDRASQELSINNLTPGSPSNSLEIFPNTGVHGPLVSWDVLYYCIVCHIDRDFSFHEFTFGFFRAFPNHPRVPWCHFPTSTATSW